MSALEERAEEQALVLSEHAARLFDAAELALATVIDDTRGMNPSEVTGSMQLHTRFRRLADRLPYVEGLWLNGPAGQLWLTSLTHPAPPFDASEMDFFVAHRDSPDLRVFVSHSVIGRSSRPTFRLSRRLDDGDGSLKAVASLTVEVGFFRRFYRQVQLPPDSTIRLVRAADLALLIEEPEQGPANAAIPVADMAAMMARQPRAGIFWTEDGDAGRVHAYRAVPGFPLYQLVSVPRAAMQAWWRPQLRLRLAEAAAAVVLLALLTWLGLRQASGQREFQAKLEERVATRTAELKAANQELETLVQEIHHRVRNNLQIVASLLSLQAARSKDAGALGESIGRVHTIGLVHQTLYDDGSMVSLRLGHYLRRLAAEIDDVYPDARISADVEAADLTVPLEIAVPLALIIHEMLSHIARQTAPGGARARVRIRLERMGTTARLAIADDNVGLPPDFDCLGIVRSLAAQIGGEAALAPDGGTRFTLTWPA